MPHVPTILLLSPSSLLPCPPRDVCISAGRTWSFQNRQLVLLHHLMFRLVRSSQGRNANRGWRDQLRGCPRAVFITFRPANADTASCISMVTALYSPPQEADTGETAARGEKGCIKEASPPFLFSLSDDFIWQCWMCEGQEQTPIPSCGGMGVARSCLGMRHGVGARFLLID